MKEIKNNLPKYWVVKLTEDNKTLFRETVIAYLNKNCNLLWEGDNMNYFYGFDGNTYCRGASFESSIDRFENNPTVLTLDEFIELSKPVEEFVLPEQWYVRVTKENIDTLCKWRFGKHGSANDLQIGYVVGWSKFFVSSGQKEHNPTPGNYFGNTEITFEQFKKYVLKQDKQVKSNDMKKPYNKPREVTYEMITNHPYFKTLGLEALGHVMGYMDYSGFLKLEGEYSKEKAEILFNKFNSKEMEKKIIGYKLIKPEYKKAVETIIEGFYWPSNGVFTLKGWADSLDLIKKAKVLADWFEPVYEEEVVYEVGDWVVVTDAILKSNWTRKSEAVGYTFQLKNLNDELSDKEEVSNLNNGIAIVSPGNKYGINYVKRWLRKATPEEIEAASTKTLMFGDV
jgi:hypothetical protein